jgi:hypothetical protein
MFGPAPADSSVLSTRRGAYRRSTTSLKEQTMNASTKRIAAIGSMIALIAVSGCASFDATVAFDDDGNSMPEVTRGENILHTMHVDSQSGGE